MQGKFKIFSAAGCCKKISRWSLVARRSPVKSGKAGAAAESI